MNTIDASVACKQLGFMDGAYAYSELLESLPTDMLTVFSDITCDGTETTLLDCVYSSVIKPTCDSRAVAGLVCVPGKYYFPSRVKSCFFFIGAC